MKGNNASTPNAAVSSLRIPPKMNDGTTGLREMPGKNSTRKQKLKTYSKPSEPFVTVIGTRTSRSSSSEDLLAIAFEKYTFFQDQYREPYGSVKTPKDEIGWSPTLLKVRSSDFKIWLTMEYWKRYGKTASSAALGSVINLCEAMAISSKQRIDLHNRVAWHDQAIYYDLGDEHLVMITLDGWNIVTSNSIPPLFRRYAHQLCQVKPSHDGDPLLLLKYVNIPRNEDGSLSDDQILTLVTFVSYLVPDIPHPVIYASGPQGSAKSTFTALGRQLVDPSAVPKLTLADSRRELAQQLEHNYCACYDNLSSLNPWSSDMFCCAATGGGFSKRELFSDDEDVIFDFKRCIILNGINVVASMPDLLDRSIIIELHDISPRKRIEETEILAKFEADKPRIVGGMFDALSRAMKIKPTIKLAQKPRMADYAVWCCAIAEVLGIGKERFLEAYNRNIERQNEEALDSSMVAQAVLGFMEPRTFWKGPPTKLLSELDIMARILHLDVRVQAWPKASHILTRRLKEDEITLRKAGIKLDFTREGKGGERHIILSRSGNEASVASEASPLSEPILDKQQNQPILSTTYPPQLG